MGSKDKDSRITMTSSKQQRNALGWRLHTASRIIAAILLLVVVAVPPSPAIVAAAVVTTTADVDANNNYEDHDPPMRTAKVNVEDQLQVLRRLAEWTDSINGGYFNPKQEFRAIGGNDNDDKNDSISFGIFATELIPRGELLLQVPFTQIISEDEEDDSLAEDDEDGGSIRCGTVRNLAREMKDPDNSLFEPYVRYLLEQPRGGIPSDWSKKGRAMLVEVLGGPRSTSPAAGASGSGAGGAGRGVQRIPPVSPVDWLEEDWFGACNGNKDDPISAKAAMLTVQRADDELMIPVYDLYNHRNGRHYNTRTKTNKGANRQITARRDIQPGEQIYNSYNMCNECGGRKNGYGTPEIFRDYGFVENFPQRWDLDEEFDVAFDLMEEVETDLDGVEHRSIKLRWIDDEPPPEDVIEQAKQSLSKELKRLYKVRHIIWSEAAASDGGTAGIPQNEWDSIWEYHQAVVTAISYVLNELAGDDSEKIPIAGDDSNGSCSVESCAGDHYHSLEYELDEIAYNKNTCSNEEVMRFPGYYTLEHLKTHYQVLNFAFREGDRDICMDLEDTLQICSCYRPHYHEYSAHFAARFIETVKRVIFIGGGDSMLLHESLKFPSLEKVVGLELDQTVTRKSFKYFRTQPHFDDDRVEWWFGDATKSLLLLPEDYWGTFDLVLVDLSETVMAFSVTEDLDVFGALALLLNKEGVMVKNELYMSEMSAVFDYTAQIHLEDNPKICSQVMAFGSNSADFFRQPQKDQDVETLLLPPVASYQDRFDYFHDYRKNNALDQGKCNQTTTRKIKKEQEKSAGILHVLDAEDIYMKLDSKSVEDLATTVAREMGFTPISIPAGGLHDDVHDMAIVVLKEGYVLARLWPEEKYAALDVGIWGGFDKASIFQKRLTDILKARIVSSFRVVVGGMYGSSTWEHDRDVIGPKIVQRRNCDGPTYDDVTFSDDVTQRVIVDEITDLVASSSVVAVAICGVMGKDECTSADVLEKNAKVARTIPIWTCPDLPADRQDDPGRTGKMLACESSVVSALKEALENTTIDMLTLDASAPLAMAQIVNSILNVPRYRDSFLSPYHIVMTWSNDPKSVTYQRNLLEQYRKDILYDPIARAEIKVTVDGDSMEVGLFSHGDLAIFHNLYTLEKKLNRRIKRNGVLTNVETIFIQSGMFPFNRDWSPKEFSQEDYDHKSADKQYAAQKPLGREVILQLESDDSDMLSLVEISNVLEEALSKLKANVTRFETYSAIGDGALIVAAFQQGNLVLVWDGRQHIDMNLFLFDDRKEMADSFASSFLHHAKKVKRQMRVALRDDFPRGTDRVINFKSDLDYQGIDFFTMRELYVEN